MVSARVVKRSGDNLFNCGARSRIQYSHNTTGTCFLKIKRSALEAGPEYYKYPIGVVDEMIPSERYPIAQNSRFLDKISYRYVCCNG